METCWLTCYHRGVDRCTLSSQCFFFMEMKRMACNIYSSHRADVLHAQPSLFWTLSPPPSFFFFFCACMPSSFSTSVPIASLWCCPGPWCERTQSALCNVYAFLFVFFSVCHSPLSFFLSIFSSFCLLQLPQCSISSSFLVSAVQYETALSTNYSPYSSSYLSRDFLLIFPFFPHHRVHVVEPLSRYLTVTLSKEYTRRFICQ